jgi:hypothetical protein
MRLTRRSLRQLIESEVLGGLESKEEAVRRFANHLAMHIHSGDKKHEFFNKNREVGECLKHTMHPVSIGEVDDNSFELTLPVKPEASFESKDELVKLVSNIAEETPGVSHVNTNIGGTKEIAILNNPLENPGEKPKYGEVDVPGQETVTILFSITNDSVDKIISGEIGNFGF